MGVSEPEEDRIVAELQRGMDVETNFHRLFSRYYGPVRQFFAHRGFAPEECEDLTQEAFLNVYRSISSYRGAADFGTWLYGILNNVYRNAMRRRQAIKRSGAAVSLDTWVDEGFLERSDPAEEIVDRDALIRVGRALRELPPQMRRTLILYSYYGHSYREVAKVLGISVHTVKTHLAQARKRLKDVVEFTEEISNSDRGRQP